MEKRETIKPGYRWIRFIIIPVALAIALEIVIEGQDLVWNFIYLLICAGLYFLLQHSRRIQYDSNNFYIIRGANEKVVPFSTIISIKKSNTKINGGRYWKLTYKDEFGKEHLCRYFHDFFSESFLKSVQKINPGVVIWRQAFFNH